MLEQLLALKMPPHIIDPLLRSYKDSEGDLMVSNRFSALAFPIEQAVIIFCEFGWSPTYTHPSPASSSGGSKTRRQAFDRHAPDLELHHALSSQLAEALHLCAYLEDVKAIGDVTLLAGPLASSHTLHSVPTTFLIKDALDFISRFVSMMESKVELRLGIHIGPVIAAVLGKQQLEYDVFGSSVNLASRILSSTKAQERPIAAKGSHRLRCSADFAVLARPHVGGGVPSHAGHHVASASLGVGGSYASVEGSTASNSSFSADTRATANSGIKLSENGTPFLAKGIGEIDVYDMFVQSRY